MIVMQDIFRRFEEKTVIQNLSHTFPDKGIFALMGPSGCGKTTLLRLLAGLDEPDAGCIAGRPEKIAMAFQEPRLLSWLNSEDNVKLVLPKDNKGSELTTHWMHVFELDETAKSYPNELSGGMKQRLSLARAMAFGGNLILLDEPFSALDEALKARIAPAIRAACKNALTILVTHNREDADLLGAEVLVCSGDPLTALTAQ